jgi:hypothetical protein
VIFILNTAKLIFVIKIITMKVDSLLFEKMYFQWFDISHLLAFFLI